ncbi:MAG: restriction endonuclease subunit S [Burkholderiaceae bacterium]|nr:MAG: restriction endonuclease subunit S [Burkholderiaceae bacterium]
MNSLWPKRLLEDLVDPQRPITYGVVKPGDEQPPEGVRLIRGGDVLNGRINRELRTIAPDVSDQYRRTLLRGGELVMSLVGNPGAVAVVPPDLAGSNLARQVGLIALQPFAEARYVMYSLMAPDGKNALTARTKGSVQQVINLADLRRVPISLPPLSTQRRIASILGAYDDLIEVNRRRIAVLEEMARRLFEEWFVHFRFPGCGAGLTDGELPSGWSLVPLEQMLVLQRGFDLPSAARGAGAHPVIAASGVHGTHSEFRVRGPGVVTGRSGTLGTVNLVHQDFWPLNTTLYVREFRRASPAYALHLLRHLKLGAHGGGAAVPTLNRNHVHALKVPCAPPELIAQFEQHAMTTLVTAYNLERQNSRLAESRDLLLPRLISGDRTVTTAERELEPVA